MLFDPSQDPPLVQGQCSCRILLAAGFVVLKGYVLARGDVATALGILQYAGLATVVTAGLLSSLPILAAAMLAYTITESLPGPSGNCAAGGRSRASLGPCFG